MSTIGISMLFRPGSSGGRSTTAERQSVDFLVDGTSLLITLVNEHGGHADYMGCIVKGCAAENAAATDRLTMKAPSNLDSGRILLFVCPECGDLACGAYSVRVSREAAAVIWSEFAYENGYEEPQIISAVGPFAFPAMEYSSVISSASSFVSQER